LIIIIMGVSGSGKTTVGRALAKATNAVFFDADDYHPVSNVDKMARGQPLTDLERQPWLQSLRALVEAWTEPEELAVLACSALSERSRERLHVGEAGVGLVFLAGPEETIEARMRGREHFMPPELLPSQLAALDPPRQALELDVRRPVEELVAQIRRHWQL
jgi:gluconokinase